MRFVLFSMLASLASLGAATSLGKDLDLTHTAVVSVSVDQPDRTGATGTLISGRLVITAGHVSPAPGPGLPPWAVRIGPNALQPAKTIRLDPATGSRPHPLFLSFVEQFGRHPMERLDFVDVGLLLLPEAAGIAPAALPSAGMLDHLARADRFLGVGYGYHEAISPDEDRTGRASDGNRRQWRLGVTVLNAAWIRLEDDPKKGYGQICGGDSGAPIFLERGGREILVGVVSHSEWAGCEAGIPTYAARVDNPVVLDWVRAALHASE